MASTATFTQLSFQNVTPQARQIFVGSEELPTDQANQIARAAWESFVLKTGDFGYSAFSSKPQLVAHSINDGAPYQRVFEETDIGAAWTFEISATGTPSLTKAGSSENPGSIQCGNGTNGTIAVSLFNNYRQWTQEIEPLPNMRVDIAPQDRAYVYASVAVANNDQALVLEPVVMKINLSGPQVSVQLLPDGSSVKWKVL